jgi:hypothetical protein
MPLDERSRQDLATAIRHVAAVTGCREMVVGGRGALVVSAASAALVATQDFDIGITVEGDRRGMQSFEAELGRASPFAAQHGFYVEHAGAELLTFALPDGWQTRATRLEVEGVVALCLAPVDVALNKLHAKRPKDIEHLRMMLRDGVITLESLEAGISACPYAFMKDEHRQVLSKVLACGS